MDGSVPPNERPPPASSPGSASNLDSFFKRLGQGQSSRLWAGPGRSGAVPGSLRTSRLQPRNEGDVPRTAAAAAAAATSATADEKLAGRASDGAGLSAAGGGAAAGSGSAAKDRRRRPEAMQDLSPFGTGQGWSERSGGASAAAAKRAGAGASGGTPFGSGSGARRRSGSSNSNNNGSAFGNSRGPGDDSVSAPPSPSPGPPRPPTPPAHAPHNPSRTAVAGAAATGARTAGSSNLQSHKPSPPSKSTVATATDAAGGGAPPTAAQSATPLPAAAPVLAARPSYRDKRFDDVLGEEVVKLDELRKLSWNGVPQVHRAAVWQLLVGYMPANRARRAAALERKRREYREAVPQYFDVPDAARSHQEQNILRQILVDVPRTCPDVPFFHQDKVQRAMERILYIWAIRHPASGYVQGINDLLTPLYVVFLSAHVGPSVESKDVSKVDEVLLAEVEADVYWCLTKLLDNIQDHYTAMQPG
ncbi:unnamed protein product, partial [Hapterophycus canaliculatus]